MAKRWRKKMKDTEKERFIVMLNGLAEVYEKNLSEMKIAIYWELLCKYSIDLVSIAANKCLEGSSFFPRPADWIREIKKEKSRRQLEINKKHEIFMPLSNSEILELKTKIRVLLKTMS